MDGAQHPQRDSASNSTDFPARPPSQHDAYRSESWTDYLRDAHHHHHHHHQHHHHHRGGPSLPTPDHRGGPSLPTSDRRSQPTDRRAQPSDHAPLALAAHPPLLPVGSSSSLSSSSSSSASSRASRSSDRKRRLTTAEPPGRRPSSMRVHTTAASSSGMRTHTTPAGSSSAHPIVLDSSPAPPRTAPSPSSPRPGRAPCRRGSDLVLPPWQPDADVSQCPVCSRPFTFLFRKHHCRKCGRVVCSSCSPHRITIPRQFIVHPPSESTAHVIDLTRDDAHAMSSFGPFHNPALGGGDEVRVCNPCVPDPNFNPPPQYRPPGPVPRLSRPPEPRPTFPLPSQSTRTRTHRSSSNVHNASQPVSHGQTHRPRHVPSERRVSYHSGPLTGDRWLPPRSGSSHVHPSLSQQHDHPFSSRPDGGAAPAPTFGLGSGSLSRVHMFSRPMFTPTASTQPHPRRHIAEEDECPICGTELPPKSPTGDESNRTQHIENCIALHSASPAPVSTMSLPQQRTRGMSNPAGNGGEGSNRATASRGMFPYVATEKDCMNNDGNEVECIICLEDFEAGDKMARLVCWCKFHEKCIKDWWDKKGWGACPTHQLQE